MQTVVVLAISMVVVFVSPLAAAAQTEAPAAAQTGAPVAPAPAAAGSITGTVADANGKTVGGATVSLEGARGTTQTRTAADGSFAISGIASGSYTVVVTRGGFETARESGVIVLGAEPTVVHVSLVQSSFSSLRVIGSTSTNAGGRSQINTARPRSR